MQIKHKKCRTGIETTKIPVQELKNMDLTWGALGTITSILSYNKKTFCFQDVRSYSYVDSDYTIKKYLKELLDKNIIAYDKQSKTYTIIFVNCIARY